MTRVVHAVAFPHLLYNTSYWKKKFRFSFLFNILLKLNHALQLIYMNMQYGGFEPSNN